MDNYIIYCVFLKTMNTMKKRSMNVTTVIRGEDISDSHHPRYHELWEEETYQHTTIGDMIFDCSWALDACLQHNILCPFDNQKEFLNFLNTYDPEDDYVMKKNRFVTQFLYKYLNKETNCGIYSSNTEKNKTILDKNTTVIAFEGQNGCNTERKSWVFCRIDTPYNEKLVSIEDSYKFRDNGKDMISFFVIIDTRLDTDKEHRNKCVWSIDIVDVCLTRALTLLPKAFTDNYY